MCICCCELLCKKLRIKPPRCYLGCILTVRVLSTIMTLILFIFAVLSRCVYYQFWKTYDLFFLLLHTAIAGCLVPLRKDDVFFRLHHIRQRYKQRGLSIKRYRERRKNRNLDEINAAEHGETEDIDLDSTQDSENRDNPATSGENLGQNGENSTENPQNLDGNPQNLDENPEKPRQPADYGGDASRIAKIIDRVKDDPRYELARDKIGNLPDKIGNVQDKIGTCPEKIRSECGDFKERVRYQFDRQDSEDGDSEDWQKKLASGLHLGICLLRLRISLALVIGMLHRAFSEHHEETTSQGWKIMLLIKGLYLHLPLLWFQFSYAIIRQLRWWCKIGCALYYIWLVVLTVAGLLLLEVPFHAIQENSDPSWCYLWVDRFNPVLCGIFACRLNGTRIGRVTFDKGEIFEGSAWDN